MNEKMPAELVGHAMCEMTKGEVLAQRCVEPLRAFAMAGGWVRHQDILPLEQMIAGYLDNLRGNR